ncbi:hypothetical protein CAPN006_01510 [Capnocytophaga canimorsus]|uniref:HIRAN domain-containing protein n=1 Tax=Capnocytophaga canimorsus TaxID=28188 RepID=UPI001ACA5F0C|nr:HIRAN domain-containing protein [Capnocytophaga canimorsus]GIM55757.1 hypothetical protein CAPN006_01510 [Capnocytophaga canimorsus]
MKQRLIEEYDLILAGTQYLDKDNNSRYYNAEGSRAGTSFELRHEDDNLYDPLAIIVLHKGKEIGYIPKDENLEIAYYLYHPEQFVVECKQKKKQIRRDYEMIVVIVKVFAIVENYRPFSFEVFDEVFADYDENVNKLAQKRKEIEQEKEAIKKRIRQERLKKIEQEDKKNAPMYQIGCFIGVIGMIGLLGLLFKVLFINNETDDVQNNWFYVFVVMAVIGLIPMFMLQRSIEKSREDIEQTEEYKKMKEKFEK